MYKDLSIITKDLSKIVIIDNMKENFKKQKNNGILISSWYSNRSDNVLRILIPILKKIR